MFKHSICVQALSVLKNELGFVSVGGYEVKVWDIRMEKIMWGVEGGQKTLTGCGLLGGGERIMTVSLDQHLKVYNGLDG